MSYRALAWILVMSWLPSAWAEDAPSQEAAPRIALPHAALSFQPEAGWELTQFDGAVFELRKDGARLWAHVGQPGSQASRRVKRYAERVGGAFAQIEPWNIRGIRDASRVWHDANDEHRMLGALTRDDDTSLDIEALVPKGKTALVSDIRKICDSFDANPFVHSERIVHWAQQWTLDVAADWKIGASQDNVLRLDRVGLEAYVGMAGTTLAGMKRKQRFQDFEFVAVPQATGERLWLLRAKREALAHDATVAVWQRNTNDIEATLVYAVSDDAQKKQAEADAKVMLRSLRAGTDPGPQRDVAEERFPTRFRRADGPPITFRFPMTWKLGPPSSKMRLAHFQTPGRAPVSGVVYWFGKGQGGSAAQNMARWMGQFETDTTPAEPKTIDIAEGVRATTLDITGTYVAAVRPGAAERVNRPDQRMLATVLEVPEGPVIIKLVGDAAAVDKVATAYGTWIRSFRVAQPGAKK